MNRLWLLALPGTSLLVSIIALRRSERARKMVAEDLISRLKKDHDTFMSRIARAKISLADTRAGAPVELRERIDPSSQQLEEIALEARRDLERLQRGPTRRARLKHEALLRDMEGLEARVQLLEIKSEIVRAQRLTSQSELVAAEKLLEAAASRMRDIRARLGPGNRDPAFMEVMSALRDAVRAGAQPRGEYPPQAARRPERD